MRRGMALVRLVELAFAVDLVTRALAACSPSQVSTLREVRIVDDYHAALDRCREQGRLSGSFGVYEACARARDRELCNERGLRCGQFIDGGSDQ